MGYESHYTWPHGKTTTTAINCKRKRRSACLPIPLSRQTPSFPPGCCLILHPFSAIHKLSHAHPRVILPIVCFRVATPWGQEPVCSWQFGKVPCALMCCINSTRKSFVRLLFTKADPTAQQPKLLLSYTTGTFVSLLLHRKLLHTFSSSGMWPNASVTSIKQPERRGHMAIQLGASMSPKAGCHLM